jgi:hypothetical protein
MLVGEDQDLGVREQDGIGIREDRGIRFIREEDVVLRRRVGAERQEATREGKIDVGFRRLRKQEGRRAKQLLRQRPALDGEAAGEQARREDGGFGEYRLAAGEKHKTSDGSSPGGGEDTAQAARAVVLRHGGKGGGGRKIWELWREIEQDWRKLLWLASERSWKSEGSVSVRFKNKS